jgi:mannose/cellobiose epimerase-like protein (N-acyl-D-glucosamine 2-epimerase family)
MGRPSVLATVLALALVVVPPDMTLNGASSQSGSRDATSRLGALVPQIEKNLRENVIAFWYPRSVDRRHGGYIVHFGPRGEALDGGTKMIVTQARMVWLSSRLLRSALDPPHRAGPRAAGTPVARPDFREAADRGFEFLRDRMWDRAHGGFYWEVDPSGEQVRRPHKHLYGQAFGLYALSEYYLATKRADAIALADTLFALLESKAHDARYGGYREFFADTWGPPPAGEQPYLGGSVDQKLMNTHLHLMEALTTYYRAKPTPLARQRLQELVAIESQAVVRHGWVACTDRHRLDWTPILDGEGSRVSYGHDIENIWLIADALRALGEPTAPLHGLFVDLFRYSRKHGYDEIEGGFFESGPSGQDADRRRKVWWVQAEALVSALTMYELTDDPAYLDVFERTWRFVNTRLTDWTHGEWHESIREDGQPHGNKAHQWKAGYHNGRALLESLERIRAVSGQR